MLQNTVTDKSILHKHQRKTMNKDSNQHCKIRNRRNRSAERHIVLCGLFRYPRGSATANYIQYWAEALKLAGYKVIVLSNINREYTSKKRFFYKNVEVIDLESHCSIDTIRRKMNGRFFQLRMSCVLCRLHLGKNDLVAVSDYPPIVNVALSLKKAYGFKTCGYPLEWIHKEFFRNEKEAKAREASFQRNREHDLIFPISHYMAEQFEDSDAIVQVVPIMADISEYPYIEKEEKKYEFIYPANGTIKDALNQMLCGLCLLNDDELDSVLFHVKGVEQEYVQHQVDEVDWNRIRKSIEFHGWMEYEELVKLYQSCHYLLLARESNQMTKANFPSKVPEVMTHGVVPIATRVGDYTEYYLKDGYNSLLMNGCDPEEVASAIRRAIHIPFEEYRKLSHGARSCVEQKFDFHNWVDIYKSCIERAFNI